MLVWVRRGVAPAGCRAQAQRERPNKIPTGGPSVQGGPGKGGLGLPSSGRVRTDRGAARGGRIRLPGGPAGAGGAGHLPQGGHALHRSPGAPRGRVHAEGSHRQPLRPHPGHGGRAHRGSRRGPAAAPDRALDAPRHPRRPVRVRGRSAPRPRGRSGARAVPRQQGLRGGRGDPRAAHRRAARRRRPRRDPRPPRGARPGAGAALRGPRPADRERPWTPRPAPQRVVPDGPRSGSGPGADRPLQPRTGDGGPAEGRPLHPHARPRHGVPDGGPRRPRDGSRAERRAPPRGGPRALPEPRLGRGTLPRAPG